ncbi:hypothetical protein SGRA_2138 [Saprospira grandis str. Lewin]|uniref:Uncharacterized protein n=1 Tax=Saprospira grandis (strain Lewin) TaxID=984262 RepID=H6L342_SAPGL|nr:hypothetical protein SGRA_2138 [Saprospira grandis str. Lewin]
MFTFLFKTKLGRSFFGPRRRRSRRQGAQRLG